jgi:serine protease Do
MNRRFALVSLVLTALSGFLVGLIVAGSLTPAPVVSGARVDPARPPVRGAALAGAPASFADIAERINPAVVNIDATSRGRWLPDGHPPLPTPDDDGEPFDREFRPDDGDFPRRGTGSGFIIDADGHILTNHHVIERAERITVKLSDGRTLRAQVVGADPDTDIALIKVDPGAGLPVAPLGDSSALRVGEWVCAIGNPLAYEHTVTVGVVSYIGRKLFDRSLDNYIQTDAAINFGNSGGPLINGRGEVIGINSAISSRASNIGFAIPVNQAVEILPQLKTRGRVSRGYMGVELKDMDPDLQRSLKLSQSRGALVQDVTSGSPADRAGLRTYDLIVEVEGVRVDGNDQLIRRVSVLTPGSVVRLGVVRDGRPVSVRVKLGERPPGPTRQLDRTWEPAPPTEAASPIGLVVRDLDDGVRKRYGLPSGQAGVLVSRVEPMSPAYDGGIERGAVVLEINRRPVTSAADYRRMTANLRAGDVLAFYLYIPGASGEQRLLRTVRIDTP